MDFYIKQLEEKIEELNREKNDLIEDKGRLEKEVKKLKEQNDKLKNNNQKLRKDNNRINASVTHYKMSYNELKDNFEKYIIDVVDKKVNEEIKKIKHDYELEIMKKDQEIFKLKQTININSVTSSLPSSKNPIYKNDTQIKVYNSRKKSNKKIGGQPNHERHKLEKFNDNEIDEIIEYKKDKCDNCNSNNLKLINIKTRDCFDIELRVIKKRYKFHEYKCLDCGCLIKTSIPLELHADNQYSSTVKALVLALTNIGYVSIDRTRKLISGLTNNKINLSEGYISKLQSKASDNVEDINKDISNRIINSKINYWDDTVVKIGKLKTGCFRVYTNDKYVLYKAHEAKNVKGMNEDGILQNLPDDCYVMHDHLTHNYCKEYKYINLECNAHLLRKLEGIIVNTNHKWAKDIKELIENTYNKRKFYIENNILKFSKKEIKEFYKEYNRIIKSGFIEYREFKHKYEYKNEENILKFMKKYKDELTGWLRDFSLPFTNNLSERSLRFIKSKLKISYQFKSIEKTRNFANIMSYIETCGRFSINKYEAMKRLFDKNPYTIEELESTIPTT